MNPNQHSDRFRFLVSTLPGYADVALLAAAARARATAVLNLEAIEDQSAVASEVAGLARSGGSFGVRIHCPSVLTRLSPAVVDSLDVVVLAGTAIEAAPDITEQLRSSKIAILVECTTADEARVGAPLRVDGLIAKGHEAAGRVGEETTFVLAQRLLADFDLPVWAHGGVGARTVSACSVAGCVGAVLDGQLALARESTLPDDVKRAIERMGGDETVCIGGELDDLYRVYRRPGLEALADLQQIERDLAEETGPVDEKRRRWREAIHRRVNWKAVAPALWPLGQDAAFAAGLARRFRSVAGILSGLEQSIATHIQLAAEMKPLDRGAPLAQAHRTEFPILQGPMTRVSDTPGFAAAVAEGGALPFLALALLRGRQVRSLLKETQQRLGQRSWGVGILGFVPLDLRDEQLAAIAEFAPPFALIAGGRPDQAAALERQGIPTYLHVPAPSLLRMFLDDGARRFVFEGRECGGHVGPRTSFVLWESVLDVLEQAMERGVPGNELHIVFAGGIHDARSAAMVATMAASLAAKGVRVGVLVGTGYLFTEEAVGGQAIVEPFQQEAVACARTVLLESGPGHATRCADTPFFNTFRDTRRKLLAEGRSPDDIRTALEMLNLGRLRIASKGITREEPQGTGTEEATYTEVDVETQRRNGMYMIGQVAALRKGVCRIADLHRDVSIESTKLIEASRARARPDVHVSSPPAAVATRVAIVGMGCLLPKAQDVRTLWANILNKVDAIGEIPPERFQIDRYYDPDRRRRDRIYSKWGGFLEEVPFDPLKYRIPPSAVSSIDPFQLLTLEVVHQALGDAGYLDRPFNRERTSVILGASGGVGDLGFRYGVRAGLPMFLDAVPESALAQLPEWTEDSFAGVLLNVAAGRVANQLDLGGLNFTVDAACASSLAAVFLAARELDAQSSDMVIVGGIDTVNSPFGYLCFSSAQALSPRGRCSTFDESADGIAISEGLTVLVLKRLADAERDGDRIYAVIRSVAGSSDGRGKGLTAPKPEGQVRVLERAYAVADIPPSTVGLIEAHGTGTVAGDGAEVAALSRVFGAAGVAPQTCALGSIKSMVGHTKAAAGVSGLVKVALALHHKILPPTLHVAMPNARLREPAVPFFVNTDAQPWMASENREPRRAGVSSFGFGGTNFHVVLEEYGAGSAGVLASEAPVAAWPAELAVWHGASPQELLAALDRVGGALLRAGDDGLRSIAATVCRNAGVPTPGHLHLAIVATNVGDLRSKLAIAREALQEGRLNLADARGVYLGRSQATRPKIAFLFPGQGSQYPGMHRDLAMHFSDLRQSLEMADSVLAASGSRRLSSYVFPPPAFTDEERARRLAELTDTEIAQPALGAVEIGLCRLLDRLGLRPDCTAGHSYGEYVALCAAGVFPQDVLFALSAARGRIIKDACRGDAGTMAAVSAAPDAISEVLRQVEGVWIANMNAPQQTVIAGASDAIARALPLLGSAGLTARRIPVAAAFHSPLMDQARQELSRLLERTDVAPPRIPVFSNSLAARYPESPGDIKRLLAEHLVRPVRFAEEISAMHADGARVFLEVGPRSVLTNLARETLGAVDASALAIDAANKNNVVQFLTALAQLIVAGVALDFEPLWRGRSIPSLRLDELAQAPVTRPAAHVWMVDGGRARRPEQRPEAPVANPQPATVPAPVRVNAISMPAKANPVPVGATEPPRHPPSPGNGGAPRAGAAGSSTQILPPTFNHRRAYGGSMHTDTSRLQERTPIDHDGVMRQFHQLMSQFLQTQALVMTTYLEGAPRSLRGSPPEPLPLDVPSSAPAEIPPRSAFVEPARHIQPEMLPANGGKPHGYGNGADGMAHQPPAVPMVGHHAPKPSSDRSGASAPPTTSQVLQQLLLIVADRTGYPEEMLAVDANIEADLGIDSIKRMEILAAFQEKHGGAERGAFQQALERLTALKTLRESAAALAEILAAPAPAAAAV